MILLVIVGDREVAFQTSPIVLCFSDKSKGKSDPGSNIVDKVEGKTQLQTTEDKAQLVFRKLIKTKTRVLAMAGAKTQSFWKLWDILLLPLLTCQVSSRYH